MTVPEPTTCRHNRAEGDCSSCAACAACDGGCGTCPYAAVPEPTTGAAGGVAHDLAWAVAYAKTYWRHGQEAESQLALTILARAAAAVPSPETAPAPETDDERRRRVADEWETDWELDSIAAAIGISDDEARALVDACPAAIAPAVGDHDELLRVVGKVVGRVRAEADSRVAAAWDDGYATGQIDHDCTATNPHRAAGGAQDGAGARDATRE